MDNKERRGGRLKKHDGQPRDRKRDRTARGRISPHRPSNRRRPERATLSALVQSEDYTRECLKLSAKILLSAGHSKQRLIRNVKEVLRDLQSPARQPTRPDPRFIADLPHVLTHWRTHPQYLSGGRPKPLPFRGTGPSLTEIVYRVFPHHEDPGAVRDALLRGGAIRRVGKCYVPTARAVLFKKDQDSGRVHALIAWLGLMRTIDENLSGKRRFVQQTAVNTHFPISALPKFRKRLEEIVDEVLHPFDEFMLRAEQANRGPSNLFGMGLFGFELDVLTPRKPRRLPSRRRELTS